MNALGDNWCDDLSHILHNAFNITLKMYLLVEGIGLGLGGREGHPHLNHLLRGGQHDVSRVVVHAGENKLTRFSKHNIFKLVCT